MPGHAWCGRIINYGLTGLLLLGGTKMPAQVLKVVTFNVWSGLNYQGSFKMGEYESPSRRARRYRLLVREMKALQPDIIGLNECNPLPEYAQRIAGDLGYDEYHHLGVAGIHLGRVGLPINLREGDMVLARPKWHLSTPLRQQLSGGPVGEFATFHLSDATQVVGGKILVNNREVYIFVTHWHASPFAVRQNLERWMEDYLVGKLAGKEYITKVKEAVEGAAWRLDEARKMLEYINKTAGKAPVLLLGDFNAVDTLPEIKLLLADGFKDAYVAAGEGLPYTWDEVDNLNIKTYYYGTETDTSHLRRQRIDYIFYRGPWKVHQARRVFDRAVEDLMPSDHFGVYAELELLPAGSMNTPR